MGSLFISHFLEYKKNKMKPDIGEQIISKLNKLNTSLDNLPGSGLKKNSQIHFMIETSVLKEIREKAKEKNISMSEWCRQKISKDSQLDRIEMMIKGLVKEK